MKIEITWRTVLLMICSGTSTWIVAGATQAWWPVAVVVACVIGAYIAGLQDAYASANKRIDEFLARMS